MVITPDGRTLIISESFAGRLTAFDIDGDGGLSGRRVFAGGLGPDGICLDAEGAVWVSTGGFSVARVAEGGQVLQHVELGENRAPFALMLGGPGRRDPVHLHRRVAPGRRRPRQPRTAGHGAAHRGDPGAPGRGARHRPGVTATADRRTRQGPVPPHSKALGTRCRVPSAPELPPAGP